MRLNRRGLIRIVLAALFVAAAAGAWFWRLSASAVAAGGDGTTVRELQACSEELPWGQASRVERVTSSVQGLRVQVLANVGCGPYQAVRPVAEVDGDALTISWSWHLPPDQPVAACLCTRRLEFLVPRAAGLAQPRIRLREPS